MASVRWRGDEEGAVACQLRRCLPAIVICKVCVVLLRNLELVLPHDVTIVSLCQILESLEVDALANELDRTVQE